MSELEVFGSKHGPAEATTKLAAPLIEVRPISPALNQDCVPVRILWAP